MRALTLLGVDQLLVLLQALKHQLNATKRVYFSHRGRVIRSKAVPDHKAQLRATIELIKLHGLCPRRGERRSGDPYDRSERPVINLVMPNPD
jgi:hypothetical protein